MAEDWQFGGFGLYLHWPFCQAKCPYCDFNSHVSKQIDQSRWLSAYLKEIDRYATLLPGRVLNSVFFGGGTPSLMNPDLVAAIIERIKQAWPTANDLEITLEANPGSVEAMRFQAYSSAGVSRISMGIQSLNDDELRKLGRVHTVAEAYRAFEIARDNFDRISFDLIYARQHQSLANWRAELREALSMAVDHLSLYQLTIEPGTAFGARYAAGGLRGLPNEDLAADMYEITQEECDKAGLPAYEVSNHAKIGAESRHNLIYWRYGDYIGIGPGAHGRITHNGQRFATEAWSSPEKWLTNVAFGKAEKAADRISPHEQAQEFLLMGLRIIEGVDVQRYQDLLGQELNTNKINVLRELNLVETQNDRLFVTPKGRPILNAVIEALSPD